MIFLKQLSYRKFQQKRHRLVVQEACARKIEQTISQSHGGERSLSLAVRHKAQAELNKIEKNCKTQALKKWTTQALKKMNTLGIERNGLEKKIARPRHL